MMARVANEKRTVVMEGRVKLASTVPKILGDKARGNTHQL
jgi:hypothetical protein